MAAEASRSATGSADSYLGSLISLTSKSEIRYEGILFNINTDEASIGLRNVRSFGTEGRRKDGQQVPASDKVYEYIVFRGSDIKDLQVKSSPPVQTPPPVPSDPAIIQSHYTAPTASSNLPTASIPAAAGSLPDFSNQVSQPGVPITTYQNSVPVYPPGGNMAPWNPSISPTTNVNGISVPMYYQGYYGPSGSQQIPQPQQLQQPLLRPVQGFSMPPSMQPLSAQQSNQYPTMSSSLPTGPSNIPASQSVEFPPPLLHPIVNNTLSMQCNVRPDQSSTLAADSSTNRMPSLVPAQAVPSQSTNSPLVPHVISNVLDKSTVGPLIPNQAKPMSTTTTTMPFSSFSESLSAAGGKSTSPALVTPGQFLQPGPTISQSAPLGQKDVEVVQVSAMVSSPQQSSISSTAANALGPADAQAPLLPLPSPSNSKINGYPSQTRYINRGGRGGRRGGNEFSRPMPNFTEDFDFEAMNEKFKKDEVWGHLGKNKAKADDNLEYQDEDDVDALPIDSKPVYKKDDFFDTLSCNALDRESRNGRTWFSDQMRLDTETFGNFPRNRGFRGGRGPGGGRSRGGYYGRGYGYGYVGRGRGQGQGQGQGYGNNVYRAM